MADSAEVKILHHKIMGEGEPLFILHGLFGMLDNWMTIGRKLSEQRQVILVDLRNHGKSFHVDAFDYYLMADDVEALIEHLGFSEVNVLGHSMGGKVAMQLAMNKTEMVQKLLVVDIAPVSYPPGHEQIFAAFEAVDIDNIKSRGEAEAQMKAVLDDFGVIQFLLKNLKREKEGGYRWKANVEVIKANYSAIIENSLSPMVSFEEPSLFIKGGNSARYIEKSKWPEVLEFFPDARLETVKDSGHWVHAEQPEAVVALVNSFLQ